MSCFKTFIYLELLRTCWMHKQQLPRSDCRYCSLDLGDPKDPLKCLSIPSRKVTVNPPHYFRFYWNWLEWRQFCWPDVCVFLGTAYTDWNLVSNVFFASMPVKAFVDLIPSRITPWMALVKGSNLLMHFLENYLGKSLYGQTFAQQTSHFWAKFQCYSMS